MKNNDSTQKDSDSLSSFIEKYGNNQDDPNKTRIISLWEREQKIKAEQIDVIKKDLEYLTLQITKLKLEKNNSLSINKKNNKKIINILTIVGFCSGILALLLLIIFIFLYFFVFR